MSGAARVRRPLHGPGVVELAAGSILARGELVVALLLVGGAWTTLVILEATGVAPRSTITRSSRPGRRPGWRSRSSWAPGRSWSPP